MSAPPLHRYGVVVPVKPLSVAKSRLAPLGDEVRRELAEACALDTVLVAAACGSVAAVLVVTDDVGLALALRAFGIEAIPDGRPGCLNETLRLGAAELVRRRPGLSPVALCADLPALRAPALDAVLGQAPRDVPSFVADATGTGTTLFTAPTWEGFQPGFGPRSRQAHLDAGAVELTAERRVRRDLDTPEDLREVAALGAAPRTAYVLTRHGLLH